MKSRSEILNMYKFSDILDLIMGLLLWTDDCCARVFDVSISTVERWKRGATEPRDGVKMLIYRTLLLHASNEIIKLNQPLTPNFAMAYAIGVPSEKPEEKEILIDNVSIPISYISKWKTMLERSTNQKDTKIAIVREIKKEFERTLNESIKIYEKVKSDRLE